MQLSEFMRPAGAAEPGSGPATFLAFARRGKPGGWRYALVAVCTVLLAILVGVALVLALALTRVLPPDVATRTQNPGDPGPFYLGGVGMPFALFLGGLALSARV